MEMEMLKKSEVYETMIEKYEIQFSMMEEAETLEEIINRSGKASLIVDLMFDLNLITEEDWSNMYEVLNNTRYKMMGRYYGIK